MHGAHYVRSMHVCNGYPRQGRKDQRHILRDHRHQTAQAVGEGERDRLHVCEHVFVVVAAEAKGEDRHGFRTTHFDHSIQNRLQQAAVQALRVRVNRGAVNRHHGALRGLDDAGAIDDADVGNAIGEEQHDPCAAAGGLRRTQQVDSLQ
eukprot:scaffold36473_cov72-Phaeocystis_antarctica.AAC.2